MHRHQRAHALSALLLAFFFVSFFGFVVQTSTCRPVYAYKCIYPVANLILALLFCCFGRFFGHVHAHVWRLACGPAMGPDVIRLAS